MTTVGSSAAAGTATADTFSGSSGGTFAESGISLDVGNEAFCDNPAHGCAGPVDCGGNCGALDSMFDENGCVRVACDSSSACDSGEFCYRPQDYGGCQSSDLSCSEFDGECGCGLDPDCGGAYCVPEEIVFGGIVEGPTEGLASTECGPADGPAFSIAVGNYASDACGGVFDSAPFLRIFVAGEFGTQGTTGTGDGMVAQAQYSVDGTQENIETAQWVVLRITQWDESVTGDYEVLLQDETLLVGTFTSVVSCPSDVPCG